MRHDLIAAAVLLSVSCSSGEPATDDRGGRAWTIPSFPLGK